MVCGKLSGMSGSIIHFPQVHLSHLKKSYVDKKSEHRSELVPGARRFTDLEDSVQIWLLDTQKTDFDMKNGIFNRFLRNSHAES